MKTFAHLNLHTFFIFAVFITLLTCSQRSQETPPPKESSSQTTPELQNTPSDLQALENALKKLAQSPEFRYGDLALSLKSSRSGENLIQFNAQKTLPLASALKAITTATALAVLGSDYRFQTYLEYSGSIQNGILEGNIYLRGGGDPSLASRFIQGNSLNKQLDLWKKEIQKLGIKKISGRIIGDGQVFGGNVSPSEWVWGDMGNYFAAPAHGLNVIDNTYTLYFKPGSLGAPAPIIRTEPNIPEIAFLNQVKTARAGTGDQASISGAPYDPRRFVSGTIPMGGVFSIKGSIPDPAYFLAHRLEQLLEANAIMVQSPASSRQKLFFEGKDQNEKRQIIHTHISPPLKDLVTYTNLYSLNLYAEAFLKAIGLHSAQDSSPQAGVEALLKYWQKQGVSTDGIFMQDGSGLARSNAFSAEHLTELLHKITALSSFGDFYQSLPIAGVSGTMRGIANQGAAYNNLRAKTGGMTRVKSYIGYFRAKNGELYSFAFLAHQYTGESSLIRARMSKIMELMVNLLA